MTRLSLTRCMCMRCPRKLTFSVLGVSVLLLALLNPTPTTAVQSVESATVPGTVVVGSGDVSAAVSTSPFGLSFRDSRGRDVLSSVPGGGLPAPTLHVSDLLGTLNDTDVVPPRYAPITFTVGEVSMTQFEQAPAVTGNQLLELSAGVTYSLTDVLSATRLDGGAVRASRSGR